MKRCITCNRIYSDDSQNYCLTDGTILIQEQPSADIQKTLVLPTSPGGERPAVTNPIFQPPVTYAGKKRSVWPWVAGAAILLFIGLGVGLVVAVQLLGQSNSNSNNSNSLSSNSKTSNSNNSNSNNSNNSNANASNKNTDNSNNSNSGDVDKANKLVDSAKGDLDEVKRIDKAADVKQKELDRALDAKDVYQVKQKLDELIEDIDNGMSSGKNAAEKIEQAASLNLDPTYKEYLSLKAQSFRKEMAAFAALREAAVIARESYTKDGLPPKERAEYNEKYNLYKKLKAEAKELDNQAVELARANPDKIK